MENQRVRLSKAMLKKALIELLAVKPIEKITVYELCAQAQINRTTFYKYYGSPYDLLTDMENDLFANLENNIFEDGRVVKNGLTQALRFIQLEQDTIKVLLSAVADSEFAARIFDLPAVQEELNANFEKMTNIEKKYLNTFRCNGGYALVRQWLNNGTPESPEEMSEFLIRLCLK